MPITAEAKLAFEDLFTRFKVADEILKWVISDTGLGCTSLVDFSSAINDGNIDVVVNESKVVGDGPKLLQGGRIRQVLKSLREAEEDAAKLKMRGQNETDLDVLLPQVELDGLDAHFWARYKVRYPAWVRPSDLLISRLSREIGKRLLSIHDIWKTRSLLHQKKSKQKKQKVGDVEITTGEPEDPEHVSRDVGTYLNLLFTLMLAFAMAGAEPHPYPPVEPEVKARPPSSMCWSPSTLSATTCSGFRRSSRRSRMPSSWSGLPLETKENEQCGSIGTGTQVKPSVRSSRKFST